MKLNSKTLDINCEKASRDIQTFIKNKAKEFKRNGAIFGLSGGVDSTVVAALCARALGKDNVLGLFLPEDEGNPGATEDGRVAAKWLGIKTKLVDITPPLKALSTYDFIFSKIPTRKLKEKATNLIYKYFEKKYGENPFFYGLQGTENEFMAKGAAHFKIKHRMRMVVIYFYGESKNLLVVGAANKSEASTGLFCKFGIDHNSDIMPLGNLYRTQILQLAKYLKIPERILNKPSSPDIIPGVEDKYIYITGLPSDRVDLILYGLSQNMKMKDISKELNIPVSKIEYLKSLNERSFHMRNPSIKPQPKTYGE